MPWPISNRDVVVDLKISQDAETKIVTVNVSTVGGYIPVKDKTVRVTASSVLWIVTPIGGNEVRIDYTAQADPGGSVPAWAVNTFCDKGPFETFKKLKTLLATGAYKNAHLNFIKD